LFLIPSEDKLGYSYGTLTAQEKQIMKYIKNFNQITINDIPSVGGKNASLGEMIRELSGVGITVPDGFAITAQAYSYFLEQNKFETKLSEILAQITNPEDFATLQRAGKEARELIKSGTIPADLIAEITQSYQNLASEYNQPNLSVAVRSSATAEDLPTASFAGQQETFLNVCGLQDLLRSYVDCLASLFTDRAIIYRIDNHFDHFKVGISVGIQKMIRSDLGSSGVAFSLDTETGFPNVVTIDASWGLGESIVQGSVTPDEFVVHKQTLEEACPEPGRMGFAPIIKKKLGGKLVKTIYGTKNTKYSVEVPTSHEEQQSFSITDEDVLALARKVIIIEKYYSDAKGAWTPMDVEWAKDGTDGKIYIIQARPETVHVAQNHQILKLFHLEGKPGAPIVQGQSIGQQIASGTARVIRDARDIEQVQKGDIIVTEMTDPDWVPAMKRASGIVTSRGGRTCHAAIVSRELNIPAIVGTGNAPEAIANGQLITLDCSKGADGYVYAGAIPHRVEEVALEKVPKLPVAIMVNMADPANAFTTSFLPVAGVGLARMEFIIANDIKIHPMALLHPEKIKDAQISNTIKNLVAGYPDGRQFFIDRLAQGIGMLAAAFYPRPVIVRLSDFKSNEYRNLIGGSFFEMAEENPMLGFRGASRYYHERYREAFALECAALKAVRETMGLKNVKIMVPFVRTVNEGRKALEAMKENGLEQKHDGLEIIMMCEVPSNVILIDEFSTIFDGFSIGSNDLTQLTLGVDRDSEILAPLFDERDEAVKRMMAMAIEGAHKAKRPIGICGQAPSDYPEIAQFLINHKIDSLSLNPDSVLPFLMRYK
jgi:pyruvate,water dikinase